MANQNDPGVIFYCAHAMTPQINALIKTAQNINKRKNIEDIHDIRVASRRIRTCLVIFQEFFPTKKYKLWFRDIKGITRAFGAVRDLDVQIDLLDRIFNLVEDPKIRTGIRRIRLRLKQRRQKKEAQTAEITKSIIESPIFTEMQTWCNVAIGSDEQSDEKSLALYQLGYKNIQNRLDELLFFEVFIFDPARIEELHQMRIAAKRLRYSLEIFSGLYEGKIDFTLDVARKTQEYLGQIHDADVWISFLPEFKQSEQKKVRSFYGIASPFSRLKPGIEFLIDDRKKERNKLYKNFLEDWRKWKINETWLNLRKVIFLTSLDEQQPVSTNNEISPIETTD